MSCRQFHLTPSRAWHLRGKTFKADSTASLSNIRFAIGTENMQKDIRAENDLLTWSCTELSLVTAPEMPGAGKHWEQNMAPSNPMAFMGFSGTRICTHKLPALWSCSTNTQKWGKGTDGKFLICKSLVPAWLVLRATPFWKWHLLHQHSRCLNEMGQLQWSEACTGSRGPSTFLSDSKNWQQNTFL